MVAVYTMNKLLEQSCAFPENSLAAFTVLSATVAKYRPLYAICAAVSLILQHLTLHAFLF